MDVKGEAVFELSWEVCNKVGGIYTVVSSKAAQMIKKYGENFYLVGPHFPTKAYGTFEEMAPPEHLVHAFKEVKKEGIIATYGKWLVKGEPQAILIDFQNYAPNVNRIKRELWDKYKIDSLGTQYFDFDEPIVWGYACGRLLDEIKKTAYADKKMILHAHEWLSGGALLYTAIRNLPIARVFTTHATTLGRAICSSHENLYDMLKTINPEEEARKRNVLTKWQFEKVCAQQAHTFTTVSEITGIEAETLLGKKPDVLVLNGLDLEKFPTFEDSAVKHRLYRERIKEFCMAYFFPHYTFELDNTLFFFLAGRYEFRDKGIDIYIKALSKLNQRLKDEKNNLNVVAFFWVPANIRMTRHTILTAKTNYADIKETVDDNLSMIKNRILNLMISGENIRKESLFNEDLNRELRSKIKRLQLKGDPPICTHEMFDEDHEIIINSLYEHGLDNKNNPPVKVIYYPIYLSGRDNLLDTTYYESMHGCHLGIFPSFYEPWGYTPMEAAALGVSSVTTDLAGFGRYVQNEIQNSKNPGIWVLKRQNVSDEKVVEDLTNAMHHYINGGKHIRVENKISARELALLADWSKFIENYITAHNIAIEKLTQAK